MALTGRATALEQWFPSSGVGQRLIVRDDLCDPSSVSAGGRDRVAYVSAVDPCFCERQGGLVGNIMLKETGSNSSGL